jgi:hypothetical protein
MRPGYETTGHHPPRYPYRHYAEMRRPQVITERHADGWTTHTLVDADQLPARGGGDALSRLAASGDPALALRARRLQLLRLAAG